MQAIIPNEKRLKIPTHKESRMAEESGKILSDYIQVNKEPVFQLVRKGGGNTPVLIPASAVRLLVVILSQMAKGNAVTLIPVNAELTTQQAADLLNVSRPFLVGLLEKNKIPFKRVGTRRRVLAEDVLRYKEEIDKKRLDVLDELAKQAQEHDMGY